MLMRYFSKKLELSVSVIGRVHSVRHQVTSEVIYRMSPFWMSVKLPPEHSFTLSLSVTVLLKHSSLIFSLEEQFVSLYLTRNFKTSSRYVAFLQGVFLRIIHAMKVSVSWKGHKVYILATILLYPMLATLM